MIDELQLFVFFPSQAQMLCPLFFQGFGQAPFQPQSTPQRPQAFPIHHSLHSNAPRRFFRQHKGMICSHKGQAQLRNQQMRNACRTVRIETEQHVKSVRTDNTPQLLQRHRRQMVAVLQIVYPAA